MGRRRAEPLKNNTQTFRAARNPAAREGQLISLATDLAEQQLRNGTASSQVITHYLKLGTEREALEREKLRRENNVLEAKANSYKSAENMEEMYRNAINALRGYSGDRNSEVDEYEDEEYEN